MLTSTVTHPPVHLGGADTTSLIDGSPEGSGPRPIRELDRRHAGGIDVRLLWNEADNEIRVVVSDFTTGEAFSVDVNPSDALEAFHHPYPYAASRREHRLAS